MYKEDLINRIVDAEFVMFENVPALGNPSCRESPENFRMHRSAQFSAWSEETLSSYLDDIQTAAAAGRNLMTYKYARMDELIPCENSSPLVERITGMQMEWQRQIISEYPKLMQNARGLTDADDSVLDVSFERYLRAELESYSEKTLELLWKDIKEYRNKGINMSQEIYLSLVKMTGLDSLDSFK